jgi:glycosyltransferase involved in cell wall biosynthesis
MERPGEALLLSNFPATGIGSFGVELQHSLQQAGVEVRFESAATRWKGFVPQCVRVLSTPTPLVANVGLTSWGRSRARNLIGLWTLGARARRGRPTTVLLHNLIEKVDPENAGYRLGAASKFFAHRGIAGLRRAQLVVFSDELAEVLRRAYGITPSRELPLPCPPPGRPSEDFERPPRVVYFGYLSPYKGVDLFMDAMQSLRPGVHAAVIGGPHSLLTAEADYRRFLSELNDRAQQTGTELLGYLSDSELRRVLERAFVAVLPYTSTTGASASFTQLASAGLPVIATELPEFRALKRDGAGVVLVTPDPASIQAAVRRLLADHDSWRELSRAQIEYARRHSWEDLAIWLRQHGLGPGRPSRPAAAE